jgi:phage shock protein C
MANYDTIPRRRFYRNSSRAVCGGVCAGVADYFGFNLRVTRILAVISLLMAMPATLIAYFGTVFLVPARSESPPMMDYDPKFRKALRSDPVQTLGDVRRKYRGLDARLAKLERYVTSPRFDLDQEIKHL